MKQVLIGGTQSAITGASFPATNICNGTINGFTTFPVAGTIKSMHLRLMEAAGSGVTVTATVKINGGATGLAVTITDPDVSGYLASDVSVNAGDYILINISSSGTAPTLKWSLLFESEGTDSVLMFGLFSTFTTNYYCGPSGSGVNSNINLIQQIIPSAGTLKNLYWHVSNTVEAGTTRTLTLYKNGSPQSLSVTISEGEAVGHDTDAGHAVTVSPGDFIALQHTVTGSPVLTTKGGGGVLFVPDSADEGLFIGTTSQNLATHYNILDPTIAYAWQTTESYFYTNSHAQKLKKLFFAVSTAPGSGHSRTVTLKKGGDAQALTVTLSDAETVDSNVANEIDIADGDEVHLIHEASSPDAITWVAVGLVGYIEEATANYSRGNYASLPSGTDDLENIYTAQELLDIVDDDTVRITQDATSEYAIHQYKNNVGTYPSGIFRWNGQSSLAPLSSPVVLQVYKINGTTWETKDTKSTGDADTDFDLSFSLADLTDYKDGNGIVTCRVYQQNV